MMSVSHNPLRYLPTATLVNHSQTVTARKLRTATQKTRYVPRVALIGVLASLFCASAIANPIMSDRTGDHLDGLNNDDTAKTIELGDFDGDGVEDLVIARRGTTPVLLLNMDGVLTNQTDKLTDAGSGASDSVYVEAFDANNDGLLDMVFGIRGQSPALYLNAGIDDATQTWVGFSAPVSLTDTTNNLVLESGDINGDGFADLFAIQVERETNDLLINDGAGNFTSENARLGELADFTRGHAIRIADVDNDNDNDIIYLESDLILYIYYNDGTGNFSNAFRSSFRNPDNFAYIFGAADFNGDGIFDYRQYSNPAPNAQMSTGTFDANGIPEYTVRTDANMLRGNRKHGTVHIRDIDGDGDTDYVLSSILRNFGGLFNSREGMRTEMVINRGLNSGEFDTFVGEDWGQEESYDMKILDINGDGNMDMFVGHEERYGVYINDAPPLIVELAPEMINTPSVAATAATLTVTLISGANVSYQWELGDGTILTTDEPTVSHVYAQPGRYQVTVTATSAIGSDQVTAYHRVHEPLAAGVAQSSMDVIYETRQGGDRLYVANPDNDSVTVVDAVAGTVISEIPVGDNPRSVALAGAGELWVINKDAASISVIDTESLSVTRDIALPAGSQPHGMVISTSRESAFVVTQATSFVLRLNTQTGEITDQRKLGAALRDIAINHDGSRLYVPYFITRFANGEDTRNPAEASGTIAVLSTSNLAETDFISMDYNRPPGNADRGDNARGIPNYLRAPALSPSGTLAMVPAKSDNIYRGSMRDGQAREHDMLVRGILSKFNLTTSTELLDDRIQFDNNSHPTAIAFGPTGNLLFVAHESSRAYEVIDVYRNEILFSDTVGFAPTGIVVSPDGNRVYIHNWLDRSLSVINSEPLMSGTGNNADVITTIALVGNEVLSPRVLAGKRLFFDSSDLRLSAQKYMSCSACHDEAGHDGRTWDFSDAGEGLRNTIDLRGRAGIGDGNVHWSSNFDEIHDFENDIREIFDGTGLLTDADYAATVSTLNPETPKAGRSAALDSLAAFTSTLRTIGRSPYRQPDGSLTESAQAGQQIFQRSGCASCHSGDTFTDSPSGVTHNIGTVDGDTGGRLGLPLLNGGLDTPTLKGLWLTAPYLHDGSAATLQEAITAHTELADFDVTTLTSGQVNRLADYMLQIDDTEPAPVIAPVPVDPVVNDGASNPLTIFIDGQTDDWPITSLMARDADDISGANNTLDYSLVWMAHDSTHWYIRYDTQDNNTAELTWGYSIHIDTDGIDNGFRGFVNELPTGTDYLLEGQILYRYAGTGQDWTWDVVGPVILVQNGPNTELAINRRSIGDPATVQTFFFANNVAVGGDARDYFPDSVSDPDAPIGDRTIGYAFEGDAPATPSTPNTTISNSVAALAVDGSLSDWSGLTSFGLDPDDIRSNSEHIDWREAWVAHNDNSLFIAYINDGTVRASWGQSVMLDTDTNNNTGFRGFLNELPIGVDYLLEDGSIYRYAGTGTDWSWIASGTSTNVRNGAVVELSMPRLAIGDPANVNLIFVGNNEAIGGTAVDLYPDLLATNSVDVNERFFSYDLTMGSIQVTSSVTVDGNLNEWPASAQLGDIDPNDTDLATDIDWRRAMLQQDGDALYIAYELHEAVDVSWGHAIYFDRDNDINTGFRGFDNALPLGADIILEGDTIALYTGATQNEWSWDIAGKVAIATRGASTEIAIQRSLLGNPPAITLMFRGDSAAVGGSSLDVLPDNGTITYSLRLNDAPLLASALDNTTNNAANLTVNTAANTAATTTLFDDGASLAVADTQQGPRSMQSGGAGSTPLMWLVMLIVLQVFRLLAKPVTWRFNGQVTKRTTGRTIGRTTGQLTEKQTKHPRRQARPVVRLGLPLVALTLAACDSGTRLSTTSVAETTDNASLTSTFPAASSALALQAALPEASVPTEPLNDVSFVKVFTATLSGTQVVPPVAIRESGTLSLNLNVGTGKLEGTVGHSLENVTSVTLHEAPFGENGDVVVTLGIADGIGAIYGIPEDTYLTENQITSLNDGNMYVLVNHPDYPDGALRAQVSPENFDIPPSSILADLQLRIFKPICSGCHLGRGDTLPGIMDFTSADATYLSLVDTVSLQNPELLRVEPGNADDSYLIRKIEGTQSVGSRMPFRGIALTEEQITAVRDWVVAGAKP